MNSGPNNLFLLADAEPLTVPAISIDRSCRGNGSGPVKIRKPAENPKKFRIAGLTQGRTGGMVEERDPARRVVAGGEDNGLQKHELAGCRQRRFFPGTGNGDAGDRERRKKPGHRPDAASNWKEYWQPRPLNSAMEMRSVFFSCGFNTG